MLAVADVLLRNQSALVRTLTEIATHASATDEINRSLMALAGAAWEIERARPPNTGTISVFHPSNNVLYAYVLYAVIPCLFANRVVVRPSARATRPVLDVHGLITNSVELPIEVTTVTQREFLSTVAGSDVVVFTGRYDNALSVAGGLVLSVFPLVSPLPSTLSAATALFDGFAGSTGLSDFPSLCISGLRPLPSLSGPSPRSQAAGKVGISRFSRMKIPCMQRFFDPAGSPGGSR